MQNTIAVPEQLLRDIAGHLKSIDGRLSGIEDRLIRIETRVDSLPTWFNLMTLFLGFFGFLVAIGALMLGAANLLSR